LKVPAIVCKYVWVEIEHKLKAELYASMLDFIALNKIELLVGLRLKEYDTVPRASA